MSRRPSRVLAIGWFGERNLGDEAMLLGLRALLERALGEVALTVMSADPAATERLHGVRAIALPPLARSGFRNPSVLRSAWGADLVTLGGGDLVREAVPGPAPARYWLRRLRVAHALRRPVAGVGLSVGDLRDPGIVEETRERLGRLAMLAVRDTASAERVAALGLPRPQVMGDLALEAPGIAPEARPRRGEGGPRIGVCVRALERRAPGIGPDAGTRMVAALAAVLDGLVADRAASIELIPFRTRPRPGLRDDDAVAGEELAARAASGASWRRHERPETPAAFAAIARRLDALVAVRLHGVVLGAAAGIPVAGIAYDPKVTGILDELGVPGQAVDLGAGVAALRAAVDRALDDPGLAERQRAGVAAARARTAALVPHLAALAGEAPS